MTLGRDLSVQSTNSGIVFEGNVAGAGNDLTVNAGTGSVVFESAVSNLGDALTATAALTVSATSGGTTFESTLQANNCLSVGGPITFKDSVTLADGATVATPLATKVP